MQAIVDGLVDGLVGEAVDGFVGTDVGSSPEGRRTPIRPAGTTRRPAPLPRDGDAQKTGARPTPKPPAKSRTSKTQDSPSEKGSSGFTGPDIGVRT